MLGSVWCKFDYSVRAVSGVLEWNLRRTTSRSKRMISGSSERRRGAAGGLSPAVPAGVSTDSGAVEDLFLEKASALSLSKARVEGRMNTQIRIPPSGIIQASIETRPAEVGVVGEVTATPSLTL